VTNTTLADLRQEGIIIGLSLSGVEQAETLQRALEIRYDGELLFGAVQATWNLLERSAEPALQAAHEAGLGVILKEVVANGRLTGRNAAGLPLLAQVAEREGIGMDGVALAGALARPWADIVLSGAATVAQFEQNLQALTRPWTDNLETELRPLTEDPAVYWATRSALPWN
jgi:aryl-alcohol dehydrogenase-like predicted oxidoreductase